MPSTVFILELSLILGKQITAIGPLSSYTYDFSISRSIWSKTGSFWSQCHQRCLHQGQSSYYISETCKTHMWASNQNEYGWGAYQKEYSSTDFFKIGIKRKFS